MLEHPRRLGHTSGNLLLSMMERYSGDFLAAVDGLRTLLGCRGHVWPITVEQSTLCAAYSDGSTTRGEVEVDVEQAVGRSVERLWLDPPVSVHPDIAETIRSFDAIVIGPGSFFTSLLPIFLVNGCREAIAEVRGPVIYIANLLTEGPGMSGFTAGGAVMRLAEAIGRPVDAVLVNIDPPDGGILERYAREQKAPLPMGEIPPGCEVIEGAFWRGPIARHDRRRLRTAVWAVLANQLLLSTAISPSGPPTSRLQPVQGRPRPS